MPKLRIPAADWTTATGDKLGKPTSNHNAEEIDLQHLAGNLAPRESVQLAPGIWFSMPIPVQFDPNPVPEGWREEISARRTFIHRLETFCSIALFLKARLVRAKPWVPKRPG